MMERYFSRTETLVSYRCKQPKRSIWFLHGLGGSNSEQYWGRIGDFLDKNKNFNDFNLHFWKYSTSQAASPVALELMRGHKTPGLKEITGSFQTELLSETQNTEKEIIIVGHSYGGVVAMNFIAENSTEIIQARLSKVIAVGSPFAASLLVKLYNLLIMGSNSQIRSISISSDLENIVRNSIEYCRINNIKDIYIEANGDVVVRRNEIYRLFSQRETVPGAHTWMPDVQTIDHSGYKTLARLLLS